MGLIKTLKYAKLFLTQCHCSLESSKRVYMLMHLRYIKSLAGMLDVLSFYILAKLHSKSFNNSESYYISPISTIRQIYDVLCFKKI